MADEGTTTRSIIFGTGSNGSNQQQVIEAIGESISGNEYIRLHLPFHNPSNLLYRFRFDRTVDMQNAIVENNIHIKKIEIENWINEKNEHVRCFNFFVRLVQESDGGRMNFAYWNLVSECTALSPEGTNQLADALRNNNNNNNGVIESFCFYDWNFIPVTFQPLWDALLDSGIRKIELGKYETRSNNQNDNIIDFTGLITNASIKELDLHGYKMSKQNHKNLVRAIAANKGIEKLAMNFCFRDGDVDVDVDGYDWEDCLQLCVIKMMRTNISLLGVTFSHWGNWDLKDLQIQVNIQIELNRMWKRYIMRREEEEKASTATAVTNAGTSTTTTSSEGVDNKNGEEERKKRFKMRMLLHLFNDNKPVLRDTLIFHLLSEYPDDLVGNDGQHQNQILLRSIGSNVSAKKKNRTMYEE